MKLSNIFFMIVKVQSEAELPNFPTQFMVVFSKSMPKLIHKPIKNAVVELYLPILLICDTFF